MYLGSSTDHNVTEDTSFIVQTFDRGPVTLGGVETLRLLDVNGPQWW